MNPPYLSRYYTVIISKMTGLAKAICYQTQGCSANDLRFTQAARNGNCFATLEEAKLMAEKINQIFKR